MQMRKLYHRQVVTYSLQNSEVWKAEQKKYAPQFAALLNRESTDIKNLHELLQQIDSLDTKIAMQRDSIDSQVEKQIQQEKDSKSTLAKSVNTLVASGTSKIPGLNLATGLLDEAKVMVYEEYKELRNHTLSHEEQQKIRLNHQVHLLKVKLAKERKVKDAMINKAEELKTYLQETPVFLDKLHRIPRQLCESIENDVEQYILQYEEKNVSGQSPSTRLVLRQLVSKLKKMMEHPAGTDSQSDYQQRYLWICALLWSVEDYFSEVTDLSDADKELRNNLFGVLENMHINREDGLPDDLDTQDTCKKILERGQLLSRSLDELNAAELEDYSLAKQRLEARLMQLKFDADEQVDNELQKNYFRSEGQVDTQLQATHIKEIQKKSMPYNLLMNLYNNAQEVLKGAEIHKKKDIKFSTSILRMTEQLISPSGLTIPNLNRYARFIDKAPGGPSSFKLGIAAGLLALTGLALITASVFLAFVSFAGASPLSIMGIALGASWMTTAVAAGTYALGLSALGVGEYGLLQCSRRGLSEKVSNFYTSVKKRSDVVIDKPKPSQYVPLVPSAPW